MDKGEVPINIYMDLSKAFDTLDHNILLQKLNYYGINDTALDLFTSYLRNRIQYVVIDEVESTHSDITTGVPQGSILGPLLFIIYINDIASASTVFKFIIYADDTTLFSTMSLFNVQNDGNLSHNINLELERVCTWLKLNKLSLNIKKNKFMLFYKPLKQTTIPVLKIDNVILECVNDFNFLGLFLDKHMSWNKHIRIISSKVSQTTGIMNKLKNVLPSKTFLIIYNSLIMPRFNYCLLAWGHKFNRLANIQKRAVRIVNHSA